MIFLEQEIIGSQPGELFSRQGDLSGARDFLHAERIHEGEKFFDFAVVAGNLNGQGFGLHVHDFGAKDVGDLHDLGAGPGVHTDLDEHEFAIHGFTGAEMLDLDDVGQFIELLDDLFERGFIAMGDDSHARECRVMRRADVERVNIVAAPAE